MQYQNAVQNYDSLRMTRPQSPRLWRGQSLDNPGQPWGPSQSTGEAAKVITQVRTSSMTGRPPRSRPQSKAQRHKDRQSQTHGVRISMVKLSCLIA